MADFIECGCQCHTTENDGSWRCPGAAPCCDRRGEPRMCPMLNDIELGKPAPPVPWAFAVELWKLYHATATNDQTLEQIARRGGFGYQEIYYIMRRYQKMLADEKNRKARGA